MSEKGTWRDFIAESLPSKYEDEDLIKTVKETIKLKLLTEQAQLKLEIAKTELERQCEAALHERRRAQLTDAISEVDRRLTAAAAALKA